MEKLFESAEKSALDNALMAASIAAFKASDAHESVAFTKGTMRGLTGAIVESVKAAVVKATRRANVLQGSIDDLTAKCAKQAEVVQSLERRASRQAEHLKTLEDRMKRLEHR
jgi:hypothetical protein